MAADSESFSPTRPHEQSSDEDGRDKLHTSHRRGERDGSDEEMSFKVSGEVGKGRWEGMRHPEKTYGSVSKHSKEGGMSRLLSIGITCQKFKVV